MKLYYSDINKIIREVLPRWGLDKPVGKFDFEMFEQGFRHHSYHSSDNYERLEFLGDSVYHFFLSEYLFLRYPNEEGGFLTKLRMQIERGDSMDELTRQLNLDKYIISNAPITKMIREDIFEAFIGVFYLNFKKKATREFIFAIVEKFYDLAELLSSDDNYKNTLVRYFAKMKWEHPIYEEFSWGYHDDSGKNVCKTIIRNNKNKIIGTGIHQIKKEAEQLASMDALETLGIAVNGVIDIKWIEKMNFEEKIKERKNKNPLPVFNKENELIDRDIIASMLAYFDINFERKSNIKVKIYQEAFTHRSYLKRKVMSDEEKKWSKNCVKLQSRSNDRLQFLGNAFVRFVFSEKLFHHFEDEQEGFLSRLRAKMENRQSIFSLAKKIGIQNFILVSQQIELNNGRNNINLVSRSLEAIIGATYINFGFERARKLNLGVAKHWNLKEINSNENNYLDKVIKLYAKKHWGTPDFRITNTSGPDHAKVFTIGFYFNEKLVGKGTARSKREAKQIACAQAYAKII